MSAHEILIAVMAAFAGLGALDRVFGNRVGLGQEFESDLAGNFWLRVSPEFKCSQIPARIQPSFIRAEGFTFRKRFCYKAGILVLGIMKRLWFLFTQASLWGCLKY